MLDFDLAELYEVGTKALNQAVKRNSLRFPADFMFRLSKEEWEGLRTQGKGANMNRSQFVTGSQKRRNIGVTPYAFTEQGVSMLSSVLRSGKAINVNIAIMRTFVFMRQYALSHEDLTNKLKELESKYNKQFKDVYEAINYLLQRMRSQFVTAYRKRHPI